VWPPVALPAAVQPGANPHQLPPLCPHACLTSCKQPPLPATFLAFRFFFFFWFLVSAAVEPSAVAEGAGARADTRAASSVGTALLGRQRWVSITFSGLKSVWMMSSSLGKAGGETAITVRYQPIPTVPTIMRT
jgi:hypothetical protein